MVQLVYKPMAVENRSIMIELLRIAFVHWQIKGIATYEETEHEGCDDSGNRAIPIP